MSGRAWEYEVVVNNGTSTSWSVHGQEQVTARTEVDALNDLGERGWEMIAVTAVPRPENSEGWAAIGLGNRTTYYYFKRHVGWEAEEPN